jgi:hypothetical protein
MTYNMQVHMLKNVFDLGKFRSNVKGTQRRP